MGVGGRNGCLHEEAAVIEFSGHAFNLLFLYIFTYTKPVYAVENSFPQDERLSLCVHSLEVNLLGSGTPKVGYHSLSADAWYK